MTQQARSTTEHTWTGVVMVLARKVHCSGNFWGKTVVGNIRKGPSEVH